jgi:hypothetical protein
MEKIFNCYTFSYQIGRALIIIENEPRTMTSELEKYYEPTAGNCKNNLDFEVEFQYDGKILIVLFHFSK